MNAVTWQLAMVAIGGSCGACARFLASNALTAMMGREFPFATLAVNVTGALGIGILYVMLGERMVDAYAWRALLITGLLGGYTTFSAFSLETIHLIEAGALGRATAYVMASVFLCLLACWLGMRLARLW